MHSVDLRLDHDRESYLLSLASDGNLPAEPHSDPGMRRSQGLYGDYARKSLEMQGALKPDCRSMEDYYVETVDTRGDYQILGSLFVV